MNRPVPTPQETTALERIAAISRRSLLAVLALLGLVFLLRLLLPERYSAVTAIVSVGLALGIVAVSVYQTCLLRCPRCSGWIVIPKCPACGLRLDKRATVVDPPTPESAPRLGKGLRWLLVLYCFASLVHFVHNAEFLADYPNLPTWLTRAQVYAVWIGITAIGGVGYVLARSAYPRIGLSLLTVYAALGLDGLAHYTRAPFAAHTPTMNLTILLEVGTAILVLAAIVALLGRSRNTG